MRNWCKRHSSKKYMRLFGWVWSTETGLEDGHGEKEDDDWFGLLFSSWCLLMPLICVISPKVASESAGNGVSRTGSAPSSLHSWLVPSNCEDYNTHLLPSQGLRIYICLYVIVIPITQGFQTLKKSPWEKRRCRREAKISIVFSNSI